MNRASRDPFRDFDPFRLYVFVPAIMSAGLLFSISTLVRDAVAARGRDRARRRAELDAAGTAAAVLGTSPVSRFSRPRSFYALVGTAALAMAAYVVPGAALNYLRPHGYVSDIAWVLCLALAVGSALGVIGVVGLRSAADWPFVRPSARWLAAGGPRPTSIGSTSMPPVSLDVMLLAAVGGLAFVSIGVAVGRFVPFDEATSEWVRSYDLPWFTHLAAASGATPVSLLLATAVGAVAVRCRTFAIAWIATVALTFGADLLIKRLVERGRPFGGALEDSFPSGHVAQLVLLAVVAPVALRVVTDRRWIGQVLGAALAVGAVAGGIERIHVGMHWTTDVLAGAALGLTAGLLLRWVVLHGPWHARCVGCPWSREVVS